MKKAFLTGNRPGLHFLCMAGHIRTLQKCPKCGKPFPKDLVCPECLTRPTRYFIDLWWQGRIKIYSDPYGRPLDSLAAAEQLLSTIRYQIGAGRFNPREFIAKEVKALRFDNYYKAWLTRLEADVARSHLSRSYLKVIRLYGKYFLPFFGSKHIRDIREGHIRDFMRSLPEHLSLKTVANILGVLHRLFVEARERRDISQVPRFPKVEKAEPETRWLTPQEQEAVLAHLKEPYRTFFLFCMKEGCRLGEARALRWDRVDLKKGVATICASFDLETWKPYTKEKNIRIIPLNPRVRQALARLPRSLSGFVFVNRQGRPLSATRVRTAWRRAAQAAGVDINAYQATRHSFCTQKLIEGHSERKVMEVSGHRTLESFRRYGKLVTEALRDVVED